MNDAWPHGDPRVVIRSILAGGRFQLHPASARAAPSWFDVLLGWFGALVRRLLHQLDRALGGRLPFETVIGFVVIAATFALLGFAIVLLVRSYSSSRARLPAAAGTASETPPRRSAELREAARRAAQARRYRDAAALLFLAAARALDEGGRIVYDPARTPGEYRRLVHDPLFDVFTREALVAVFAAGEPAAELFDRMSGMYDRLFDDPAARRHVPVP